MNSIKTVFLLVFLIIGNYGLGQQFAAHLPPLMDKYPFFNQSVIKTKQIKTLTTSVMYKVPNRKLVYSGESQLFSFDENGNVSSLKQTTRSYVVHNTKYFLNKQNQLETVLIKYGMVSELKSFEYNQEGLLIKELLANSQTAETITEQEFKYEFFTKNQYKKYWLNDEGLTYKYTVVDLDELGRKDEERTRYIRGASRETNYYSYENNQLVSYSHNEKEFTRREVKYLINYSENGDVVDMNKYEDGAYVTRYEYLYEEGLLIAVLQKNIRSQEIRITKIKYTFY